MCRYASATFQNGYLRLILPDGAELRYGDPSRVVVPGAKGEEWRGRPAIGATLRIFDFSFFRKVSSATRVYLLPHVSHMGLQVGPHLLQVGRGL